MHWAKARSCCPGVDPPVFDETPEPVDPTVVLDVPAVLDGPAVLDEPGVLDEPAVLDELPPHAATSSTVPAVTARAPARCGHARHQRQRPPVASFMVSSSWPAE